MAQMEYRRLGRSGLKVSVLSFGSWVTFANANQIETAAPGG
jgi:aryl-alcohol dehydrogenase-like predicted oxidoreductase